MASLWIVEIYEIADELESFFVLIFSVSLLPSFMPFAVRRNAAVYALYSYTILIIIVL
jgi:hypothetical protein